MSDDRRVYSDEEFAVVLRKATELANRSEPTSPAPDGLTLAEMKAVAAQVGIDPALVERAARLLPEKGAGSRFERVIGGPLRHSREVHLPVRLDEDNAAQLLSAVRIHADQPGEGHSSSVGMVWQAARTEVEALRVTARPEDEGTAIAVHVDRTGTMALMQVGSLIGFVAAASAAAVLGSEVGAVAGVAAGVSGMGGIVALARSYWASSTRHVRERVADVTDAIGHVLAQSGSRPSPPAEVGGASQSPGIEPPRPLAPPPGEP